LNRHDLPIFELEQALVEALRAHSRILLQAPTGSGKSTQIPQMILDHGLAGAGEIIVLQPRRLATRMLAARVAAERQTKLGDEVGYQIRLDNVSSAATRIRFVTEGILLRQMISDPRLQRVGAILFDEFHERHLYGDITLARALDAQEQRPDLKLIVMSATLDRAGLEAYLSPCRVLASAGRTFSVEITHIDKPLGDWPVWDAAADELTRVAATTSGDVLVFMPGAFEINRTIQAIRDSPVGDAFLILPLHGELPAADQDAAVARSERRKVIVSTNVAETSLTIDGVTVVIDSGLAKIARFDPRRGINTLLVEKISRASAEQRAGRAGRTAPGCCVRLWTEREHQERPAMETPEVRRLDLAEVVLTLKATGIADPATFRWLEAPEPKALQRAETLLADLGALEIDQRASPDPQEIVEHPGAITALGRRMLAFPVHPRYARMLLAADEYGCVPAVAMIAALTQGRNILRRGENKRTREDREDILGEAAESDFFILLRALRYAEQSRFDTRRCGALGINVIAAREAIALAGQFMRIAQDENLTTVPRDTSDSALQRCVLAGFPDHVAMRLDAATLRCALVHGRKGVLARESVVSAPLFVASEVREVEIRGEVETLLTLATAIQEQWLRDLFSAGFHERDEVSFDTVTRRVVGRHLVRFHDLVLRSEPLTDIPMEEAARLLAQEVSRGGSVLKNWDHAVEQWITRVNAVAERFPELGLPSIGPDDRQALLEQICHGALSYKEVKDRPVWPTVKAWLSAQQARVLEDYAPERYSLPGGRTVKLAYASTGVVTMSARIQELFEVTGEIRVGRGQLPVRVEILAPNQRPVQIATNLETFWRETYPKLKRDLERRYPKHKWR
jgi:ATP-dependent helicase HrpB